MTVYGERIRKVQNSMAANSLLFVPAAPPRIRNRDTHYRYRAYSDTLYLTGVNEEELALLLTNDTIFVCAQESDPARERWTGKVHGHDFFRERLQGSGMRVQVSNAREWRQRLKEQAQGREVLYYDYGRDADLDQAVLGILSNLSAESRKGVYAPRTITRASEILHNCRLIKDSHDLAMMRRAAEISGKAHNLAADFIRSGSGPLSEYEVKALIEHEFMKQGADQLAYPSIVAAGPNATVLHYERTSDHANPGDLILIDAGAEYEGYASDITRTTPVGGAKAASALKRDLLALVLAAQKAAIAEARPGRTIEEVHQAAVHTLVGGLLELGLFRQVPDRSDGSEDRSRLIGLSSAEEVAKHEYHNLFYMHRTSHFLGLDVHDVGDYYTAGKSRQLEAGMVITVEPGLYFPAEYDYLPAEARGIGIRIEDDVLITPAGNEVLTAACRV